MPSSSHILRKSCVPKLLSSVTPPHQVLTIVGLLFFAPIPSFLPHIMSGKLRGLAVTGLQRSPSLPSLPTVNEAGLPGFEMSPWFGVLAPAGTSAEIIARLNGELVRILRSPDVAGQFSAQGVEPAYSTPEEFLALIKADLGKWGKVIAEAGIKGE